MSALKSLSVKRFGPIDDANVEFGDLTVLVGPQATGKSLFLQLAKLLLDIGQIRREFRRFNIEWHGDVKAFVELYFGEGMETVLTEHTTVRRDGKSIDLSRHIVRAQRRSSGSRMFYIPAQRVLTIRDGLTRPFTDYRTGDPFVVREFSEQLHELFQSELARADPIFPRHGRLKEEYRRRIAEQIFGGFSLRVDRTGLQRRIVLAADHNGTQLPFLVWSAGQREFVPLLLGLYWLLPAAKVSRRNWLQCVVIEEPEMGLHPRAINTILVLVLELLHRGYQVCLSTHSPHVLDLVWALRIFQSRSGTPDDVLRLLGLRRTMGMKAVAESSLCKRYRVYYFSHSGTARDISGLDPGSTELDEADWGGLTEFSGHVGDIVAEVIQRSRA